MAAHLKTGIEQVLQMIEETDDPYFSNLREILGGAVNLSCWTEDSFPAWDACHKYVRHEITIDELESRLRDELIRANATWLELGKPSCREEWRAAKQAGRTV